MAFDMGFNFRATAGYVTDPSYAVPVLAEAYPNTYTNGDGKSINGGFSGEAFSKVDRAAGNDPRIAGINYAGANGTETFFNLDLSSGSAPGAGDYELDAAWGDTFGQIQDWRVLDTSTVLIDGTNGGAGTNTAGGEYLDASLGLVTASATWTGTPVTKTFATTLCKVGKGVDNLSGANSTIAHFRLTLQGGTAVRRRLMLLGVGA